MEMKHLKVQIFLKIQMILLIPISEKWQTSPSSYPYESFLFELPLANEKQIIN